METVTTARRKLIDIQANTFNALQAEASRKRLSLKKYIEGILDQEAQVIRRQQMKMNPQILRLVGSARPKTHSLSDIDDERLHYILSK